MIRLTFLGAAGTVTGSKILVEHNGSRVLIDCGLFQGFKQLRELNWKPTPIDPSTLDAVVLTHAHIDHTGYLPLLVSQGYKGPIYATSATAALCAILLPDTAHLQQEEAEHANRGGWSKHRPAKPLYTVRDAEHAISLIRPVPFNEPLVVTDDIQVSFHSVGHILGAAMVRMQIDGKVIVFSGDIGRPVDPLLGPPEAPPACDAMVLESTYGARPHPTDDSEDELAEVVRRTVARGGVVVVPTFAVGRAQRVLLHLNRLLKAGKIPRVPVYLDSPLAARATGVFRKLAPRGVFDPGEIEEICDLPIIVESAEQSAKLSASTTPSIILAGSGMATGGRVVHHLRAFAPDPRNTVLFTGYQAGGTRGDRMLRGEASIKIFGEYVPVHCEVQSLDNLSAHADADELMAWLATAPTPPKKIWLNHGTPEACDAMRVRVRGAFGLEAKVPMYGEVVDLL